MDAPWFEDFTIGDNFSQVPAITITEAYTAIHQAIFADRLILPLNHPLSSSVTGRQETLVNPSLVCNFAIGQSTVPSQRVMGNLFYRGLILRQPVFVGDTLTTTTKVVALRQNKIKPGRPASGMVALEIHVTNQNAVTVMLFWRCPMIPCQDKNADTGHSDSFDRMPEDIQLADLVNAVPRWELGRFRNLPGAHFKDLVAGASYTIDAQDTITLAPELVRMTLNLAMTHTDATRSVYGKRLVYGGHTISMAAAQLSRALPNMLTLLGWFKCDHLAPVFEEDILCTRVSILNLHKVTQGGIAILHVETYATRGDQAPAAVSAKGGKTKVLDWQLAALFA